MTDSVFAIRELSNVGQEGVAVDFGSETVVVHYNRVGGDAV